MSATALWWAVVASGLYHGINPGMGWPLAVSASLMDGKRAALPKALLAMSIGHFLSMALILLPFSILAGLVQWQRELQVGAGLLVAAAGIYLLFNRRHPRILARIPPGRLALWSFLAAIAHGAGLMLVPIFFGLCQLDPADTGHLAMQALMGRTMITALAVAAVHSFAMIVAGGIIAVAVYLWLGLRFLSQSWVNLDVIWAVSLIVVGLFGILSAQLHLPSPA